MTTTTRERGASAQTTPDFREWVRASAAAQGLPEQIEDPGIYAQLAAIIVAGRKARAATRSATAAERAS